MPLHARLQGYSVASLPRALCSHSLSLRLAANCNLRTLKTQLSVTTEKNRFQAHPVPQFPECPNKCTKVSRLYQSYHTCCESRWNSGIFNIGFVSGSCSYINHTFLLKISQSQWPRGSELDLWSSACTGAEVRFPLPVLIMLQSPWVKIELLYIT